MHYSEFRRQIGRAGLTNREFAKLLKVNERSVSNMSSLDSVPNHMALIAFLMGELADNGVNFREKLMMLPLKSKKIGKSFNDTKKLS